MFGNSVVMHYNTYTGTLIHCDVFLEVCLEV